MVHHAVRHGLHIYPKKWEEPKFEPSQNGTMHNSRDKFWKRKIFKARRRRWDETKYGKAVIHESVILRTAGYWKGKDGPYKPWILKHDPDIEPWTQLSDWKTDPSFRDDTKDDPDEPKDDLAALEGWCAPKKPAG